MKGKVVFLILLLDCNGSNQLGIRSSLFISHRQKHHLWKELKLKYWTKGQRLTKYVIHVILQDLLLQPLVFSQSQEISSVVDYPLIKVAKLLCWLVFFFFFCQHNTSHDHLRRENFDWENTSIRLACPHILGHCLMWKSPAHCGWCHHLAGSS